MRFFKNLLLTGFFALSHLCSTQPTDEHQIIYLISPPRSLSVAFLRMMQARGDYRIIHEPDILAFHIFTNSPEFQSGIISDWFNPDAPKTFQEIENLILSLAHTSPVFIKEMSFAAKEFLNEQKNFAHQPNIAFVILLRDPHHEIISFYKKLETNFDRIASYQFSNLVGYKTCYEIYEHLKSIGKEPLIILSEDLYNNPQATIEQFCASMGIPFMEHSLYWESLSNNFNAQQDWHEIKQPATTHYWHDTAIQSTGFCKPHPYEIDNMRKPTFNEIKNAKHKQICINAYEENLPFYHALLRLAFKP